MGTQFWLILLGFIASAFFSGAETALISVNKVKLQSWQEKGGRISWLSRKYLNQPGDLLSTLLVGNNLSYITITVLFSDLIFKQESLSIVVTALVIPLLATPPVLLIGEIIPKVLSRQHASRLLPMLAFPLWLVCYLLMPVARATLKLSILLLSLFGIKKPRKEQIFTRDNIRRVLDEKELKGALEEDEREYISGVFDFSETMVREVMTTRTEIVAASSKATLEEIAARMHESGYSRIAIYEESLDHITGIVHVQDLLGDRDAGKPRIHPVIITPETKKCDTLLYEMRQKRCHLAVVLDEYGGTAGIVTLEDLMEELVGDIHDVHDSRRSLITVGRDLSIIVDGRTRFEDLQDKIKLPPTEYEIETIGGLLVSELGRIPEEGEKFQLGSVIITVLEASPNRVERLRLKQTEIPEEENGTRDSQIRPLDPSE
ncbi:MAG: HlyC/CorC family transporter [Candidatus Glassbacteria bacterium]|nr:HlyC/CorC family transporter [Candidatus Glassbacteria bacterium]